MVIAFIMMFVTFTDKKTAEKLAQPVNNSAANGTAVEETAPISTAESNDKNGENAAKETKKTAEKY